MDNRRKIKNVGFTLIELLIVVAIIAILASIAIPNFLHAQIRAKLSRVKADFQSIKTAIESYCIDNNTYPPGYKTSEIYGLDALTTPISYMSSSLIIDPFGNPEYLIYKKRYTYELMNKDNRIIEDSNSPYTVNPSVEYVEPKWWFVCSRGPDGKFGFKRIEREYDIREKIYNAERNRENYLSIIYDPTNGIVSMGNIFGFGGDVPYYYLTGK